MQILAINKKSFVRQINQHGWRKALNILMSEQDIGGVFSLLKAIRLRQGIWQGLADVSSSETAVIIETGFGSQVISLAAHAKSVVAIYLDSDSHDIVKARCEYLNICNINHQLIGDARKSIGAVNHATLVVPTDAAIEPARQLLDSLKRSETISHYLCLSSQANNLGWPGESKSEVYYFTGSQDEPFAFIDQQMKRKQLGSLKYFAFQLKTKLKGQLQLSSNVPFEHTLFGRIIEKVSQEISPNQKLIFLQGFHIKPLGALLCVQSTRGKLMIRVALDEHAEKKYRNAAMVTGRIGNDNSLVPETIIDGNYSRYYYQVETCFPGQNISAKVNSITSVERIYQQAFQFIFELQLQFQHKVTLDEKHYQQLIEPIVERVKSSFSEKYAEVFARLALYLRQNLLNVDLTTTICHGDFSVDNLMMSGTEVHGVIDWEFAKLEGLPLVDLLFFIVSIHKFQDGISLVEAMQRALIASEYSDLEKELLDKYCHRFGVSASLIKCFKLLTIFNFLNYRLDISDELDRYHVFDKSYVSLIRSVDNEFAKDIEK